MAKSSPFFGKTFGNRLSGNEKCPPSDEHSKAEQFIIQSIPLPNYFLKSFSRFPENLTESVSCNAIPPHPIHRG